MCREKFTKICRFYYRLWYNIREYNNNERVNRMSITSNTIAYGKIDSIIFAAYLNKKAKDAGYKMNATKIHKLLYICYGLYLAAKNEQLLSERPKAWDYGPAFPRVHKILKSGLEKYEDQLDLQSLSEYDFIIDPILDHFGNWTAGNLVDWTHKEGSAWRKQVEHGNKYEVMDNMDIRTNFKVFLKND